MAYRGIMLDLVVFALSEIDGIVMATATFVLTCAAIDRIKFKF